MEQQDKDLTAYCGLFCGDCIRYKSKASDLAFQLTTELMRTRFKDYAKAKRRDVNELESYDEMTAALEAIYKLKCDTSCRSGEGGCMQSCKIAECVRSKCIEGCWKCMNFEACDKFTQIKSFHGSALQENLKLIKTYGDERWAIYRNKFYTWL